MACFFGEADRRFYLKCLADSASRRGCAIHAYVLMGNHVHLLTTPSETGAIGAMMQDLGRRYVRVINTLHGRTGTLWEARYKSSLIDSENYFLTCQRYIELNPVRAGMVAHPRAYLWSSHSHYTGERESPLVSEHPVYLSLASCPAERRAAYLELFQAPLEERKLAGIRQAINTDSGFGSEAFLDRVETELGRSARVPVRGRPAKSITGELL
jgi:putative transposase